MPISQAKLLHLLREAAEALKDLGRRVRYVRVWAAEDGFRVTEGYDIDLETGTVLSIGQERDKSIDWMINLKAIREELCDTTAATTTS